MNTSVSFPPPPHPKAEPVPSGFRFVLAGAGLLLALGLIATQQSQHQALLFAIGLGLGFALFHATFGFSAAYRKAIIHRDISGVSAQIFMIALAGLLFAPFLSNTSASGAWAPVGVQVAIGAFLFGIGMQIGGACASGTLFSIGGGNLRMLLTLLFFCLGTFLGSLHLGWWAQLPDWGTLSLGHLLGWGPASFMQSGILLAIYLFLRRWAHGYQQSTLWHTGFGVKNLVFGPWPLIFSAAALALLNLATLITAGHPWTVTWAFTLWGGKLMQVFGWQASTSTFWTAPFQANALGAPLWQDTTSLMNIAVLIGAFVAAFLSQRLSFNLNLSLRSFAASLIGGLLMGYGARLAYGCNIGALFSGMASTSLHAWLWLICALLGTWIGIRLRPLFGLGRKLTK